MSCKEGEKVRFKEGDRVRVTSRYGWTSDPQQRPEGLVGVVTQRINRKLSEEPPELADFVDVFFSTEDTQGRALPATFPVHIDAGTILTFAAELLEKVG
jgi:hypothetical protein